MLACNALGKVYLVSAMAVMVAIAWTRGRVLTTKPKGK